MPHSLSVKDTHGMMIEVLSMKESMLCHQITLLMQVAYRNEDTNGVDEDEPEELEPKLKEPGDSRQARMGITQVK